ncbi:MAG TPA: chemotaxis protein CheW [Burkholderiaceae bacterium]|nr:chemotaxis protein CheW [Burkholderiaceae bacterium]HMX09368.1 chemotaxis protein CheW [Burkholderiaceae bacterium]HMY98928.1 chemotaxis protein CheW [Burkholderiaceae bacterium]HNB07560.1 chemotaxis protein CheW [Thauera aminoaromatica]HNG79929.1 chemotaxis protein CheW [Burkholderiaceae bacterium]
MAQAPADKGDRPLQYLTFWLGEEVFGMDIRTVREIIQAGPMTALPLMPAFVRGVINLRGSVVPVVDLNARFGRTASTVGKKSCVVVFDTLRKGERVELGLLVDAVSEVIKISPADIEPPPDFGSVVRRDFILGIGKVGRRFVVLLEPDRALDVQEMAELCDRAQESALA